MTIDELLRRGEVALRLGVADYAAALAEHALSVRPGDARTRLLLGQAFGEQGRLGEARQEFDLVLERDPENVAALVGLGMVHSALGNLEPAARAFERAIELQPNNGLARDSLARLRIQRDEPSDDDPAVPSVAAVRWQLRHGPLDEGLRAAGRLLQDRPGDVAILLARLEAVWRHGRTEETERAARQILARHPRFLKPRLILGHLRASREGCQEEGRDFLRRALADDPGRLVADRLLRDDPILRGLGVDARESLPEPPIAAPPEVEAALAVWPPSPTDEAEDAWVPPDAVFLDGEPVDGASEDNQTSPDSPQSSTDVAANGTTTEASGRPADYLVVASRREALERRYGADGYQRLQRRLELVRRELADLGTPVVAAFLDDPACMLQLGLRPMSAASPGDLKRAIDDVIATVRGGATDRSSDVRPSVILLGGDDVVPLFRVPNPADDDDTEVATDNPYAVVEGDCLYAPSLPLGRLPDGPPGNVSPLVRAIDNLVYARRKAASGSDSSLLLRVGRLALQTLGLGPAGAGAFACASASWRPIADLVFAGVTPGAAVRLSPPVAADQFDAGWLSGRRFLHFDLHGTAQGEAWYGEGPPGDDAEATTLPIVLTPDRLAAADLGAPVVFSTASYAARVAERSAADSLALRFLSEGAAGFVGSTALSYGSVAPPLAGADLLGHLFWREVRAGRTLGDALRLARRDFIQLMLERQDHLDGEDQKTLLAFVLYGDPQWSIATSRSPADDDADDLGATPLLCNGPRRVAAAERANQDLRRQALEALADVCPDLVDGTIRVQQRAPCAGGCHHPGHRDAPRGRAGTVGAVVQLTARKDVDTTDGATLVKLARITVGTAGDPPKTLVTR